MKRPSDNDPLARWSKKRIFFACILLSRLPTTAKMFLISIWRYFDRDARNASTSYAQIARACSCDERTAKRYAKVVRPWLIIEVGKGYRTANGRTNLYHGDPPSELVEELRKNLSGVASDHPDTDYGVASDHSEVQQGGTGAVAGWHETTQQWITIDASSRSRAREIGVSDSQLDQFNWVCNHWGHKADVEKLNPLARNDTDRLLDDELAAFVDEDPQILFGGLVAGINDAVAKAKSGGAHTPGISAALKYLRQGLRRQVQEIKLSIATGQTKALSVKDIQERRHANRVAGLNGGLPRARRSAHDIKRAAFGRGNEH